MNDMKASNLSFRYKNGDKLILKDISVDIPAGEFVCLLGQSGCGKSTFLRCLNLLETPTKGDIVIDDMHLTEKDFDVDAMRKRVGMVFQKPNPFPMSIYDNIAYGPRTHGIRSKAKLDDIVEKRKEQLQREKDYIEPQDMKEMALNSKNKNHGFKEVLKKSGLSVISEV